jgi:HD superfamily phosphodiesterase
LITDFIKNIERKFYPSIYCVIIRRTPAQMSFLTKLFHFVIITSKKYNIDESHGLAHSMNVLYYANEIYESELPKKPFLEQHKKIIFTAAALHDMCDKKYMSETEGVSAIQSYLENDITEAELDMSAKIMTTMSYSKVKANGFPNLGAYQDAYHIVREADLLTAYDFDRCMIYNMYKKNNDIESCYEDASQLFDRRVLRHNEDYLFLTDYAQQHSQFLHYQAVLRRNRWQSLIHSKIKP